MVELQQFHYGQFVHHGEPKGKPRVLAKSAGLIPQHAQAALNNALIPSLADTTSVAWGVLRLGAGMPACLTRAEKGEAGVVTRQFIMLPLPFLKRLAGNVTALYTLVNDPLPTYEMLGDDLPPLSLPDEHPPTTDEQVDSLLELMTYTKNNTRKIEPLLASIISGRSLVVVNAPADGQTRSQFVQGMLVLLPASTRFGISFLLHNTAQSPLDANIMFMPAAPQDDAMVYDWDTGEISDPEAQGDYSRFIIGQLRLDAELVTQQTEKLTPTAGWRYSSGDSLAEALDYASYRSKIDRSIENNMPVDIESVSKILTDDPTLPDDLRVMYARHLLNISLAMDNLDHADPLVGVMHADSAFEEDVYKSLKDAVDAGQGSLIFETLVNWMTHPQAPEGVRWQQLIQRAGLDELSELLDDGDPEFIGEFLDDLQSVGEMASGMMPTVVDRVQPVVADEPELSAKLLLLAIRFSDDGRLQDLLQSSSFTRPLPDDIRRYLTALKKRDATLPDGILVKAARQLGGQFQKQGIMQFVKLAYRQDRLALVDRYALREVVNILTEQEKPADLDSMAQVARGINTRRLNELEPPAPRLLLQILLKAEEYDALAQMMITHSRDYYGADNQFDYMRSVQLMFAHTPLTATTAIQALDALEANGIRDIPLLAAICGALRSARWSPQLEPYALRVIRELSQSPRYTSVMPTQVVIAILQYYARQRDIHKLRLAARTFASTCASKSGRLGLSAANNAYKMLDSNPRTQPVAFEIIRQYIREAADKPARYLMNYYGKKLGDDTATTLQIAYEFSNMMGRLDLITYADSLRQTVDLLQHSAEAYQQANNYPQLIQLRQFVETLRQSQSTAELRDMADAMRKIAHSLVILSEQHERRSRSDDRHLQAVTVGEKDPLSIPDVMRAAGGELLGERYPFHLRGEVDVSQPFGNYTPAEFVKRVKLGGMTLHTLTNARPTSRSVWTHAAIVDELRSRLASLPGDNRELLQTIGRDWQRLSDLITHIVNNSNSDVIQADNATGKKLERREIQPQNPLDLYRFVYGYFSE